MASVSIRFLPLKGYTKLHIFESATKEEAPGAEIEVVTVEPANPPDKYTTDKAVSPSDWFSIQWEDAKGAKTPYSEPYQGGTESLVGEIVDRVLQRDSSLDERVVTQEAEAVIERYFNVDPYSLTEATYQELSGMTYLVMARAYITKMASSSDVSQAVIGLVSMRTASGATVNKQDIDRLIEQANRDLNIGTSYVFELEAMQLAGSITSFDQSRLIAYVGLE